MADDADQAEAPEWVQESEDRIIQKSKSHVPHPAPPPRMPEEQHRIRQEIAKANLEEASRKNAGTD